MNIGFDYDDTYTRDPEGWRFAISILKSRGHRVYLVTWRTTEELEEVMNNDLLCTFDGFFATSRQAKEHFMFSKGICIDVWIDDNPRAILHTMEGWEQ